LLKNVPFERQARFLHDSVCPYPDSAEFAQALGERANDLASVDHEAGLRAHRDALRRVYGDTACVEGRSDKAKYMELTNTVAFLYAFFAFGALVRENDGCSVWIDKASLGQTYKKGSVTRRERHLAHHGFAILYLSEEGECGSLGQASQLAIAYDRHPYLVPALHHLAACITALPDPADKPLPNQLGISMKADYEAAILRVPIPRDGMDSLRDDILATVDGYRQQWEDLVYRLRDQCGLECSGFWHYGASPSWGVSFSAKGEKPLAILTLGSNIIFVEFTLPLESADQIIRHRASYSELIREKIESFHCVQCPKECDGSNMAKVDGVRLCTGRAEARRIYATLSSADDSRSKRVVLDIIGGHP
jgi:hypothetical protein